MNKFNDIKVITMVFLAMLLAIPAIANAQDEDATRNILKQGLLGAGTGAIAASTSGGNAGQGALVGAGTSVIGGALLDAISGPPRQQRYVQPPRYIQAPVTRRSSYQQQPQEEYYYPDEQVEEYYEEPPQESSSSKIIKQGLVGAGAGALAAGTSGGDAGKGALIGAGTTVIGSALLDTITQPSTQRSGRVYRRVVPQRQTQAPVRTQRNVQTQEESYVGQEGRVKVVKKYNEDGKLISEEEIRY